MSFTLPIIESCNGCGACCLLARSPPFAVYLDLTSGNYHVWDDADAAELERLTCAPPEALAALQAGDLDERPINSPCSWLDLETRRCRYYEHRPQMCRQLELAGDACRASRKREGIG